MRSLFLVLFLSVHSIGWAQRDSIQSMDTAEVRARVLCEDKCVCSEVLRQLAADKSRAALWVPLLLRQTQRIADLERARRQEAIKMETYRYFLETEDSLMLTSAYRQFSVQDVPPRFRESYRLVGLLRSFSHAVEGFERKAMMLDQGESKHEERKERIRQDTEVEFKLVQSSLSELDQYLEAGHTLSPDQRAYRTRVVDKLNQLLEQYIF